MKIKFRIEKPRAAYFQDVKPTEKQGFKFENPAVKMLCILSASRLRTLKEASIKKLKELEMWRKRRILKISWMGHVLNIKLLDTLGPKVMEQEIM